MTFQETYNAHKDLVYNLALQYIQNVEEAEEITQDVFVSVFNNLNTFNHKSNIKTWLYRITVNKSLDYLKAKRSKKRWSIFSPLQTNEEKDQHHFANFNHPGVEMEQKEATEHIFNCLNKLPDRQKTVLILLKIEQTSQAEASEILNISPKAIESLFQRAKKNLNLLLKQTEGI
jgi:RNA polymerase sigma-70 factor (ECF subfamily)